MPTFGQLAKGARARKTIQLGISGAQINAETGAWEGGIIDELDVRPLNPIERATVLEKARAFAIARGIADPKEDDELYEDAKVLHTLVLGCIDKDSPENDPKPYFEGGFEQLYGTELLLPDHIGYLYEQQQLWEDECSPRILNQTPQEYMAAVAATAAGDQSFFLGARPGMRWSFLHTTAARLVACLTPKSPSGTPSSSSTH